MMKSEDGLTGRRKKGIESSTAHAERIHHININLTVKSAFNPDLKEYIDMSMHEAMECLDVIGDAITENARQLVSSPISSHLEMTREQIGHMMNEMENSYPI